MSRFICPEADGAGSKEKAAAVILAWVFKQRTNTSAESIIDNSGTWNRALRDTNVLKEYTQDYFNQPAGYTLNNRIGLESTAQTVQELASNLQITIEETDTDAGDFTFNIQTPIELYKLPYWVTIYQPDKIILALPKRLSTSKYYGRITTDQILSRVQAYRTVNYYGETGTDYTVSADTKMCYPGTIDDGYKDQVINKHKALKDTIVFQAGQSNIDADPLDWINGPDGNVYIIVSKKQVFEEDNIIYTAIREYKETGTYSGADATPVGFALTDAGGGGSSNIVYQATVGSDTNRVNMTGLDLLTDEVYDIYVNFYPHTSAITYSMYFNGDTSATNYEYMRQYYYNTNALHQVATNNSVILANDSNRPFDFHGRLTQMLSTTANNYYPIMNWDRYRMRSVYTDDRYATGYLIKRALTTNITQFSIQASSGNGIKAGTMILVTKRGI